MPIYEYLCEGCGRVSEVIQKLSDSAPKFCPECGSRKIAKLVSRSAFQLKGGGWYADLYSSTNPTKKGARDAADAGDAPGKADAKTDAKPEATAAATEAKPAAKAEPKPAAPTPKASPAKKKGGG